MKINLFSHRGNNNHSYRENTKEAIFSSLSKGYINGVEIDIKLTKDKKIIVYHNSVVIINNKALKISNLSLLKLRKLKINTLDEILMEFNSNKKILIDIKYQDNDYMEVSDIILKSLKNYEQLNIYLCSFNYKLIKYLKKNSLFKCGIIASKLINRTKIDILDFNVINYDIYKTKYNKETFIWTINTEKRLNNIISLNRENINIITDKAYLMSSIISAGTLSNN